MFFVIGTFAGFIGWLIGHGAGAAPSARAEGPPPTTGHEIVCVGHVDVEHGVTGLAPLRVGRVAELLVREGEAVPAGGAVLRLEREADRAQVEKTRAAVAVAEARQSQARQAAAQHQARLAQQRAGVEAARCRLAAAEHGLARKRDLEKARQINIQDVAVAEKQVEELRAVLRAEKEKLAELELCDPVIEVRRAQAEVAAAQATLAEAQHALGECILKAPEAGTVLRILVGPGDVVGGSSSQPAVMFCANAPRLIRAEVEQEYVRHLRVGSAAVAEDDSRSGGVWRGRLTRVSDWYTKRRAVMREPLQANDVRTVECVIELEPGQAPLRIGQRMRVVIRTDTRRTADTSDKS